MANLSTIVFRQWDESPAYSNTSFWESKMYSFAGPKNKFNVSEIIVTGKGNLSSLIVEFRNSVEGNWLPFGTTNFETSVDTKTIKPIAVNNLKGIDSIQFRFRFSTLQATTLAIDDIYIVYRTYRELSINED